MRIKIFKEGIYMSNGKFLYRDAKPSDYKEVASVIKEIFDFDVSEKNYMKYMEDDSVEIFVAESDERIAGVLCAEKQWHAFEGYTNYYLRNCGVLPQYREQGIYSKLISMIKEKAFNEGIHAIELTCGINRPLTHRFYLNHGFTIKKTLVFISELKEGSN
ncbi:MAG: GNAT family N-acetyltransferase [Lachnospiraceae bacterium]|nr:GNAT family N-acetyltransferase [Lachnospiraceae bacterium]